MRRREFIAVLGSAAAAWPLAARAQRPTVPVIGYLSANPQDTPHDAVSAFHLGLFEAGYVEGRNLVVEYRWAENHLERLPGMADDLVRRQVAVIIAPHTASAVAAKAATKSIPIVFGVGVDPVETGLVASLNRPGGNLTGISSLLVSTATKRLELLHELMPAAASIAFLVNPTDAVFADTQTRETQIAARALGVNLLILYASDPSEFEPAFASLALKQAGGLVISGGALFSNYSDRLVSLATHHRVPTMYSYREVTTGGGLMSYGTDLPFTWHLIGVYAGRILKGEKPADLPVQQVTKLQLVINLKTAKALGLTIPETLLATADEVIQ
jgi:putative tryptophan/tyrosine transport system substrate-binding protein